MSVVYSINETLKIKNEHNYKLIVGAIRFQYTLLGALMLNNDAKVFELNLKADGKDYSFSGEAVTPEFKELLDAMRSAIEIELNASYEYWWRGGYANMNIGPFPVCELIEDMLKEGDVEAKDKHGLIAYFANLTASNFSTPITLAAGDVLSVSYSISVA